MFLFGRLALIVCWFEMTFEWKILEEEKRKVAGGEYVWPMDDRASARSSEESYLLKPTLDQVKNALVSGCTVLCPTGPISPACASARACANFYSSYQKRAVITVPLPF